MGMMKLSEAAERALTNARGTSIGAMACAPLRGNATYVELLAAGMVNTKGGLTRAGSIRAIKLKRAEEERLFPL